MPSRMFLTVPTHVFLPNCQVFAFYLGNQKEGELIIGGTDPDHYLHEIKCVAKKYRMKWSYDTILSSLQS